MVHEFLPAVGFSKTTSIKTIRNLLKDIKKDYLNSSRISLERDIEFCEINRTFADDLGIRLYGEIEEFDGGIEEFERHNYFPYFKGSTITSYGDILVEKRPDRLSYIGMCEDIRVEVSVVFHLQNTMDLLEEEKAGSLPRKNTSVNLSGLANSGMILLPVQKSPEQEMVKKEESRNRMMLLSAAREGDPAAMESLTLDDIDTYSKLTKRLAKEDVFTIVDTYFMPYGAECDQYSIMGEIKSVREIENNLTKNQIYALTLDVNELQFDVCVPKETLVGEPAVGRRFKGNVWMQGYINFE